MSMQDTFCIHLFFLGIILTPWSSTCSLSYVNASLFHYAFVISLVITICPTQTHSTHSHITRVYRTPHKYLPISSTRHIIWITYSTYHLDDPPFSFMLSFSFVNPHLPSFEFTTLACLSRENVVWEFSFT